VGPAWTAENGIDEVVILKRMAVALMVVALVVMVTLVVALMALLQFW
jgi:hypothetical protein